MVGAACGPEDATSTTRVPPQPTEEVQQSNFSSSTTHNIYEGGATGNSYPCEQYDGQDYGEQEGEEHDSFADGFNGEDQTSYQASEAAMSAGSFTPLPLSCQDQYRVSPSNTEL